MKVFAFDIGTGSLGECVRVGLDIRHKESLLIPDGFASTNEQALRRRAFRTRVAHKKREEWLNSICKEAGIELLTGSVDGNPGDRRLEREFGDDECYTSCLLRIKLLRGEELKPWQIYKALHSAIQRRGYGTVPWAEKESKEEKNDPELKKAEDSFHKEFKELQNKSPDYAYPCFYDAWKMGLFNPDTGEIKPKIDHNANPARGKGHAFPRGAVEAEIRKLVENAATQFPYLAGKADYVLYGPAEKPYASYDRETAEEFNLKRGSDTDWQGVLSQKIPRFDNRIIDKCALIPRLNVCKADDGLNAQVTYLMKLKNIRVYGRNTTYALSAQEIKELFDEAIEESKKHKCENKDRKKQRGKVFNCLKKTPPQWEKWCKKHDYLPLPGQPEIEPPKTSGRSRFSRPALALMRELILSGKSPHVFHKEKIADIENSPFKLAKRDLDFLLKMPDDWNNIHVPDSSLERFAGKNASNEDITRRLIGSQNDPVVRHRLEFFSKRLDKLEKEFGKPDCVTIEFVRTDFMSEEKKREFEAKMKQRRKDRQFAKEEAEKAGATAKGDTLKMELMIRQGYECIYSGNTLSPESIDHYEVDHIVPRSINGSDSMNNKVLTTNEMNQEKGDRTPFEWLHDSGHWEAYLNRVKKHEKNLGWRKAALLTSENAQELDEKYTSLAETAWIAKLAKKIVELKFEWDPLAPGGEKRVNVISGGLTARIRKKYHLNKLLLPPEMQNESDIDEETFEKKNREDKRHHALDAMVLSFIPEWVRDNSKSGFFRFPKEMEAPCKYFEKELAQVVPYYEFREKTVLDQMIYSAQDKKIGKDKSELWTIIRRDIKYALENTDKIVDENIKKDFEAFMSNNPGKEEVRNFIENYRIKSKDGKTGAIVKKVKCWAGKADEFADISKDKTGQFRKGKEHNGYFVCMDDKEKVSVHPIYVHQSVYSNEKELEKQGLKKIGFFYSNCLIEINKDIDLGNRIIPAGKHICSTIRKDGQVKLKSFKNPIGLKPLLDAGFRRIR